MALLTSGTPLPWSQVQTVRDRVKSEGIKQFIHCYNKNKDRDGDPRSFGYELEFMTVNADGTLWTGCYHLITQTLNCNKYDIDGYEKRKNKYKAKWLTEYGSFMAECIPNEALPEDLNLALVEIEPALKSHQQELQNSLPAGVQCLYLTVYPLLGTFEGLSINDQQASAKLSDSLYAVPDVLINEHPRYRTLTKNIRERRGRNVDIQVPGKSKSFIHMDAMVFGMGNCCLQATFQTRNLQEAFQLYDCLVPIAPILMAVSAAAPIFRGQESAWDCRWNVVAMSVDDRTEAEMSIIRKSRFSNVSRYLTQENIDAGLNDVECPVDAVSYESLREGNIPESLALHIGHLFIRDPLVIFSEFLLNDKVKDNNNIDARDHFENIQSTNWQSLRFKLPPEDGSGGWRIEFRVLDIQLDSQKNARLIQFLALVVQSICRDPQSWRSFCLPISKVDENMELAHAKDAVLQKNYLNWVVDGKIVKLSAFEILSERIIPLLLGVVGEDLRQNAQLEALEAINFVASRAQGIIPTDSKIIRDFYAPELNNSKKSISREMFIKFMQEFGLKKE